MAISSLATYRAFSPNHYNGRAYPITKITIHHMAGNLTVEQCGNVFASSARQASSNYGVGSDGRIGCYVDEANAAWTSSNWDNDNRAVTIEVANNNTSTWSSSDAAYKATKNLVIDICKRNGIKKLTYTGNASGIATEHQMFAATACPGPWWHARMGTFVNEVNAALSGSSSSSSSTTKLSGVGDLKQVYNGAKTYHRFYNSKAKPAAAHRYAAAKTSKESLIKQGYKDEGTAFSVAAGGTVPIYCMRNDSSGDTLYTADFQEAAKTQKAGWTYKGVYFFGTKTGVPVYRLFNKTTGEHLYTTGKAEATRLKKNGWKLESSAAWYVKSAGTVGAK